MKKAIQLYNETGEKRTVWEVLQDIKKEFEIPKESYTIEVSEEEISKTEFSKNELSQAGEKFLWCIEKGGNRTKILPVNSGSITIHGKEEMWFFICCLLD